MLVQCQGITGRQRFINMTFRLDEESNENLKGVNIELAKVVLKATEYSTVEFDVVGLEVKDKDYGYIKVILHNKDSATSTTAIEEAINKAAEFWNVHVEQLTRNAHTNNSSYDQYLTVRITQPCVKSTYYEVM